MCAMCDGATHEEVLADTHARIERFGFTLLGVEPDQDHPPWLYTIGLVDNFDHPELSILGAPLGFSAAVLNHWARYVIDGHLLADGETGQITGMRYSDDETTVASDVIFHIDAVDERLLHAEMFNQWHQYYLWRGGLAPPPEALELIICGAQPDIFTPGRANRAARRARARRKHRRSEWGVS